MTSLLENNQHLENITVYVMGEGLSCQCILKFKELFYKYRRRIEFLDTENLIRNMQKINIPSYRGSYAANMRLFVADIIPDEVDRLLYLDSDTVIVGKLDPLIDLDMKTYPIAMVLDSLGFAHKKELGISGGYYNSGTILFQMRLWKKGQYTKRIIHHIESVRSHYPMPDQDLLNVVCQGEIMTLEPQFNLQPIHVGFSWKLYCLVYGRNKYYSQEDVQNAVENPVIYHFFRFCGEFPWNEDTVHPYVWVFDHYLHISPWKDYKKERAQLSISFSVEKWMYKYMPSGIFMVLFEIAHRWMVHKANRASLNKKNYKKF